MGRLRLTVAVCAAGLLAMVWPAAQGAGQAPPAGQPKTAQQTGSPESQRGRSGAAASGAPVGGTLTPAKADERGWGWQVKAMMDPATPRPLYNRAKERLLRDKQITSYTISSYDPELYCEVGKHFDYIWFEMQHSTMSYDDVRRMILALPSRRSGSHGPHAGCARIEHSESHRPRRPWDHRSHRRRRVGGSRLGTLLPVSPVRTKERGWRRLSRDLEPAWPQLSRDDQRQHARDGDD